MNSPLYIREGRMGEAKSFKTGAIVGSYPKPMLVFCLDQGGLDVIPAKGASRSKDALPLDITSDDIAWVDEKYPLAWWLGRNKADLPPVVAVDYYSQRIGKLSDLYSPVANRSGFASFIADINLVLEQACPYATVVLDPITGLSELIHSHLAAVNPDKLKDPRKWTPDVGYQVVKILANLAKLPAHVVSIFHSSMVFAENGVVTGIRPMLPSQYGRDRVAGLLSQWFYACKENGKPVIWTSDKGYVKGLGCRWPHNLPQTCGPLYKDIYMRA
jgi:hypothetical protein